VHSLEDAIELIASQEDAFIIGGAQIYKEAMEKNVVDQLDITKVHQDFDADVFFPAIDSMVWEEVSRENFSPDEKNLFTYSFINYKKTV
jgi:dihydrofolate reductase